MNPDDLFQQLTDKEYRIYHTLARSAVGGKSTMTQEQLAFACNTTARTVRRVISSLSQKGLIRIIRTKRNRGFTHYNHYELVNDVRFEQDTSVLSTAVPDDITVTSATSKPTFNNTSCYKSGEAASNRLKGIIVTRKWNDDDEIGGWGLMPDEVPSHLKEPPVKKSDPRTRDKRPRSEWTPADVASEFSHRVWKALQDGQPNPVNKIIMRNAIAKARLESGLNALIELDIMDMFFERGEAHRLLVTKPQYCHSTYLRWLKVHYKEAKERVAAAQAPDEPEINLATQEALRRINDDIRA